MSTVNILEIPLPPEIKVEEKDKEDEPLPPGVEKSEVVDNVGFVKNVFFVSIYFVLGCAKSGFERCS